MGTVTLTDAVTGTTIDASLTNNNNTALKSVINGGLDNTNLNAGAAIAASKIALSGIPGYEINYTEYTSSVALTTSIVDIVSSGAITYDGTAVIIEFFCPRLETPAGQEVYIDLYDGATDLGRIGALYSATTYMTHLSRRKLTPSAGSHTYKIRGLTTSGTGSASAGAGGATTRLPGYIRVTKA